MPKIKIKEYEKLQYINRTISNNNTVLFVVNAINLTNANEGAMYGPYTSLQQYNSDRESLGVYNFNDYLLKSYTNSDNGSMNQRFYNSRYDEYVWRVLSSGLPVMIYFTKMINNEQFLGKLLDKITYRFKFIVPVGLDLTDVGMLLNIVSDENPDIDPGRGDCVIFDDYRSGADFSSYKSSYLELFYPQLKFPVSRISSEYWSSEITLPASYAVLSAIASGVSGGVPNYSPWAGPKNGVVSGVSGTTKKITLQEVNNVYDPLGVNSIMEVDPYGYVIMSNKTSKYAGTSVINTIITEIDKSMIYPTSSGSVTDLMSVNFSTISYIDRYNYLGLSKYLVHYKFIRNANGDYNIIDGDTNEYVVGSDNPQHSISLLIPVSNNKFTLGSTLYTINEEGTSITDGTNEYTITSGSFTINTISYTLVDNGDLSDPVIIGITDGTQLNISYSDSAVSIELDGDSIPNNVSYSYTTDNKTYCEGVVTVSYNEVKIVESGVGSKLTALNVRLAANEVKRSIYTICLGLAFDSNDYILWSTFNSKLSSVLDGMKNDRAVNDYRIYMDESIVTDSDRDAGNVPGVVKVDFNRAAESFDISFELTPSGAIISEE